MFQSLKKVRPSAPPPKRRRLDDAPEGELERVLEVKHLCEMAAKSIGSAGKGAPLDEKFRFRSGFKRAFALAQQITDRYYRDRALLYLIGAALVAEEHEHAQLLFRAIEADTNRKAALKKHPELGAHVVENLALKQPADDGQSGNTQS